jgi:VWFA-related protein
MITLPRVVFICWFSILWVVSSVAQQSTPTPLPYSESIPYTPRVFASKPEKKQKDKGKNVVATVPQPSPPELMPGNGPAVEEDSPVTIPVSVFDAQGNIVSDLRKEDFTIDIDGTRSDVISVQQRTEPLNFLLLIDVSPSSAEVFGTTKKLADAIIEQISANDKISLFKFAGRLKQLTTPIDGREKTKHALKKLDAPEDGTSLYDATDRLVSEFISANDDRTIVIVLTDGVDTTSIKTSYLQALISAEKSGAAFFPVYLDTFPLVNDPKRFNGLPTVLGQSLGRATRTSTVGSLEDDYTLGRHYLNDLVVLSGGRALDGKSVLIGTAKVSTTIADEIRQQYYVTFSPVGAAYVGQRKHIKVRVNRPNLAVIARGSYIVGSPPSKLGTK